MKRTFYSIFFIFSVVSLTNAQETWNLKRCIDHAIEHNIDVRIQQNLSEKAAYNLQQSQWSLLPSLNGWGSSNFDFRRATNQNNEIASGPSFSSSYGISLSLRLFSGFTSMNTIAANRYNVLAVQESSKTSVNQLVVAITGLFAQVLYQKKLVSVLEEQLNISKIESERIAVKIEEGLLEGVAQLEIDAIVSGNQLLLSRAQNEYRIMRLKLAQIIEIPENTNFDPAEITFEQAVPHPEIQTIDEVYSLACKNYPPVMQKEFEMVYYSELLKVAKGNLAPSLTLNGGYSSAFFSTDTLPDGRKTPIGNQFENYLNPSVGLSLNVPIFNGRSRALNVKRSQIDLENALYALENRKKLIRQEIEEALLRLETFALEYDHAQKNLSSVEKSFETFREKYRLGMISTVDFMTAQSQLAQAKADLTLVQYSWVVQEHTLQLYQGGFGY
jgi:outer membrane protein